MATIVGIQFQKNGKVYNFDTNGLELRPDDYVVADTAHGADLDRLSSDAGRLSTRTQVSS